jgi:hypothetical protein
LKADIFFEIIEIPEENPNEIKAINNNYTDYQPVMGRQCAGW